MSVLIKTFCMFESERERLHTDIKLAEKALGIESNDELDSKMQFVVDYIHNQQKGMIVKGDVFIYRLLNDGSHMFVFDSVFRRYNRKDLQLLIDSKDAALLKAVLG